MNARISQLVDLRRAASQSGFRVKPFADLLGMEVRTLAQWFVEAFGCSPQWLAHQRMFGADGLPVTSRKWDRTVNTNPERLSLATAAETPP